MIQIFIPHHFKIGIIFGIKPLNQMVMSWNEVIWIFLLVNIAFKLCLRNNNVAVFFGESLILILLNALCYFKFMFSPVSLELGAGLKDILAIFGSQLILMLLPEGKRVIWKSQKWVSASCTFLIPSLTPQPYSGLFLHLKMKHLHGVSKYLLVHFNHEHFIEIAISSGRKLFFWLKKRKCSFSFPLSVRGTQKGKL